MDYFNYRENSLCAEDVAIEEIVTEYGSPCYIYSKATLERHWHAFDSAFGKQAHLICYAVKANSNIAILNTLARLGSGFDIVSLGELERVLVAKGDPKKVVFSGVGKREDEIRAALQAGIRCFNIEVKGELDRINQIAGELGMIAPVSFRVNPDVDAKTHPYISTGLKENKFGIDIAGALGEYRRAAAMQHIEIVGIDCHIGSQLTETRPFLDALDRVLKIVDALKAEGINLHHLDLGGGLGICYNDETPPEPAEYVAALLERLGHNELEILLEPGRAIAGNAGILVTKVEYLKPTEHKNFAIVDAAMNDLVRPSLYSSWQAIIPVQLGSKELEKVWDIVGPVCETGDFLGKDRCLALREGDLLAIRSSGAYGFTMSSNYNSRPRVAELMVDGENTHLIRERETIAQLWAGEHLL
ncbi:diaminopimelate decarboxylase [Bathymodiolus platifrons methanotrophic gill symbiont]|uniref:diaminopimelate decarboxylase n=1 Tax=Bathymodiolus platifrons methanotrophic gill symbiont TaxID=113268 RepID=UPI000B41D8B7|nr:diaminopimelate decarboxylase [Bathymodiolus platifrons methanotrophic gill symbiont]MCK5870079.1 diaminopimelate decarboxylase [Methyloprofundus sp.]TXK95317.1 diaminopimelate decarboxylase [Methylococcaceae bacterium HT1]TXK97708.1 diaminopimelate decarboxylase [Methylococcaceae bacterium CS4]TXK99929.1 diaminopimelate decarboxylase [Methylococcaceae bacterium CS5]TXL06921.1 diaminopimelate decarboxylase [Methylococcaceae bacterium CS1]TXL07793.1 diaminopimelate decarboxylase [Methylococ